MADVRTGTGRVRRKQVRAVSRGFAQLNAILADPKRARAWSDHFVLFGQRDLFLRTYAEQVRGVW